MAQFDKPEREVVERLGLELGEERALERVLEGRVNHVRPVFEDGGDEAEETRLSGLFLWMKP